MHIYLKHCGDPLCYVNYYHKHVKSIIKIKYKAGMFLES